MSRWQFTKYARLAVALACALVASSCSSGPSSTFVGANKKAVEVDAEFFTVYFIPIDQTAPRYTTRTLDEAWFRWIGTPERHRQWKDKQFQAAMLVARELCGEGKTPSIYGRQNFPDDVSQYVDFECINRR